MTPVIILGTGGNCIDILDAIEERQSRGCAPAYECIGFLDDDPGRWGTRIHGVPVLGPLSAAREHPGAYLVNGIGSERNFWRKPSIIARTEVPADRFVSIIHPTASVSRMSRLGRGVVVLQNATITAGVTIGDHVIVLPNTVVSHDVTIGSYTCVTGGVAIAGGVQIGARCYLGTNCAIISDVTIGDEALVGMGSVVLSDVPPGTVVVGNPARYLRRTHDAALAV